MSTCKSLPLSGIAFLWGAVVAMSSAHASTFSTLNQWIAHDALSFSLESGSPSKKAFDNAVDKVIESLGNQVELLGFGEALHGGENILLVRNRLFQRLVTAHGYSAISIESSFAGAWLVNEYVAGRGPEAYEALVGQGFSEGVGEVEANRELVEWMRFYNRDPAHKVKLSFYGAITGMESPGGVLKLSLAYLISIDRASGEVHRKQIDPLLSQIRDWENPGALADNSKSPGLSPPATALRMAIEEVITELRTRRPELVAKSSNERYLDALHGAMVAREVSNFHAALARKSGEPVAGPRSVRDASMADNLMYQVERERARGKVMVFAHNIHLQRGKSVFPCCGQTYGAGSEVFTWWPAGAQLSELMGHRYAVIGTGVGESEANGIARAETGSLEARLVAVSGTAVIIPTHRGQGLPASEVAALVMRSGTAKNLTYTTVTQQSFTDFDYLCIVDSTPYSRGAPPPFDWKAPSTKQQ